MSLPHRHGRIVHPKNGDPLFLAVRQSRRDHVQAPTDFSSEMAAPSMAPAPMTPSDSTSANLVYLYHVSGEEREGCANGATLSISRPAGIQRRGLYIPAIELAAVNA